MSSTTTRSEVKVNALQCNAPSEISVWPQGTDGAAGDKLASGGQWVIVERNRYFSTHGTKGEGAVATMLANK